MRQSTTCLGRTADVAPCRLKATPPARIISAIWVAASRRRRKEDWTMRNRQTQSVALTAMAFASARPESQGGEDLWSVREPWSAPTSLRP